MAEGELAVVALGANLGDRQATLDRAGAALARLGTIVAASPVFETAAVGPPQPDYLNGVVLLRTALAPDALLEELLAVERRLGRERRERWGPRVIDLDLVAYGARVWHGERLELPHPEAHRRAFVLAPLCEVAPDFELPGYGVARALLAALPAHERASVRRVGG